MQSLFTYTVWLGDNSKAADQESEHQFNVFASSRDGALEWGDKLTARMSKRRSNIEVLRSSIDTPSGDSSSLPMVVYGHYATDDEIGW